MSIRMIMVTTTDGFIGRDSNHNPFKWTSQEDKDHFKAASKEAGVFIVGRNTYDAFGQPLPGRLNIVLTSEKRKDIPDLLEHKSGDLKKIISDLQERGFENIIVAGGAGVNTAFIKEGLIDEIQITIEPKLFGTGLSLFKESIDVDLELLEIKKLNDNTINLVYKVKK